jgi:hypothetical protein
MSLSATARSAEPAAIPLGSNPPIWHSTSTGLWSAFVIVFAFLSASFPVRHIDVLGHLAAGRDVLAGRLAELGPNWLFDIGLYLVHSVVGEFGTVFVKAVGVGAVGWLLLRTAGGGGRLVAVGCVSLAVVCVGVRANVRPETASYLVLAGLLWLLSKPARLNPVALGVLFLLWANVDRGIVTGFVVLTIVLVGRWLDGTDRDLRRLGLLLSVAAVCGVLNPTVTTVFRGEFALPRELQAVVNLFKEKAADTSFPWSWRYVERAFGTPAILAYYPLLLGGLLSFVLNRRGFRWERLLPWALTAGLSAVSDRGMPTFAIVSGPILARNLSEFFATGRTVTTPRWVSAAAALTAAMFLVALWPGWLLTTPYEPRRWAFDLPRSPAAAAHLVRDQRANGTWPADGKTAHLSEESRRAFRWYVPDDDGVFDPEILRTIADMPTSNQSPGPKLTAKGYTRLVVYSPEAAVAPVAVLVADASPSRWELVQLTGNVAVFAPPGSGDAIDLTTIHHERDGRSDVPRTPPPTPPTDWLTTVANMFTTPSGYQSVHRDEAELLLAVAEASRLWVPDRTLAAWQFEQAAGLVAAAAGFDNALTSATSTALRLTYIQPPDVANGKLLAITDTVNAHFQAAPFAADEFLTGTVYEAVRAARRAVAENPTDHRGHLLLGTAYYLLMEHSRERAWSPPVFRKLSELRQAQATAALVRAVELSPTPLPQAHRLLNRLYTRMRYLDLAVQSLRVVKEMAVRRGDAAAAAAVQKELDPVEKLLAARTKQFEADAAKQRVGDRADAAVALGLHGLALKTLRESDVSAFGAAGAKLQLDLMVRTGRAAEVIDWTADELKAAVGPNSYHWFRGQAMAAVGDYDGADRELAAIVGGIGGATPDPGYLAETVGNAIGRDLLSEAPVAGGMPDAVRQTFASAELYVTLESLLARLKNLSEVNILRAVLALEVGDRDRGRELLKAALFFSPELTGPAQLPTRVIAQGMLDRLEFQVAEVERRKVATGGRR